MSKQLTQISAEPTSTSALDLVWGADLIGKELYPDVPAKKAARRAFHLLENGHLAGAKKIGGRWVIARAKLRALFLEGEAA